MARTRSLSAPFGERNRSTRQHDTLVSRGVVVESGVQHRARQAVRAAEQLSRQVVEGLEEGVVIADGDLRAVSWNAAAVAILGVESEAIHLAAAPFAADGALLTEQGEPVTAAENFLRAASAERGPVRQVLRRPVPNRGDRWITVLARPITGRPGEDRGYVCTFEDVTQTVEAERDLREQRDRAQRYLEVASTLVVVLDEFGRVELINQQGCDLLGFDADELVGEDWFSAVVPDHERLSARMAFTRLVSGVEPPAESIETVVQTREGQDRIIAWRNAALANADGRITSVLRSGEDVTERRQAEAEVAFLAYHDPLTSLANRAMLEEQLGRDLAHARRHDGTLALLYLDLDDFKLVNDSLGHSAGDLVLAETAKRISDFVRAGDLICRQGGDEFLLLLNCGTGEKAEDVALEAGARIIEAMEQPFSVMGTDFHIGASIGAAIYPVHARDAESLFKCADTAMYQAKRTGGGSMAVYEEEAEDARERLALTTELRRAVSDGQLRLHYQPIYRVEDGSLWSLEALVRWEHPEKGLISPGLFIPMAEQTGIIDAVGDWVVKEMCRQALAWAVRGRYPGITFNVSPRQLRRPDLAESIVAQIARYGLPANQFCAELTETSVLTDERRQHSLLSELHDAGLRIAVDDFGSGHSSLARLRDLPVEILKVDRSFLAAVPGDAHSSAIVAAVLELGTALGLTTVVEGVEEPEQLAFLEAHRCPLAQGFLMGRPGPPEEIVLETLPDKRDYGARAATTTAVGAA